jgi:hypothetical protein
MELDVRRDHSALRVCMIVLAVLGGATVAPMLVIGLRLLVHDPSGHGDYWWFFVLPALFAVGLIATFAVLFSKGKMGAGRVIGVAVYRSLVIVGLIVVLAVAALLLLIVVIFACAAVSPL